MPKAPPEQSLRYTEDIYSLKSESLIQSELGWSYSNYYRSDRNYYRPGAETQITDLDLRLRNGSRKSALVFDVQNTYRIGEDTNYVKPYELYIPFEAGAWKVEVGRALQTWSASDSYWKQGLWQPRFMDERLQRSEAGLTGVFGKRSWGGNNFLVWASPVHVPEMGSRVSIQDHQVSSKNPWFRPPPEEAIINGELTPIHYRIPEPDYADLVMNPGAGFSWESDRSYLKRISYSYKPMPQLLFGFPFFFQLSEDEDSSYLDVEVHPRVVYHHLFTYETFNKIQDTGIHTSITYEHPDRDQTPDNWITQESKEALVASAWIDQETDWGVWNLGAYSLWGGFSPDRGEFAPDGTLFEYRFMYNKAVRVGWTSPRQRFWGRSLQVSSDAIFDWYQEGLTWENKLFVEVAPEMLLHFSADFIGLTGNSRPKEQYNFFDLYRANDRFQTGLSYVF